MAEPDAELDALVEALLRSTGLLRRRLRAEANPGALTPSQLAAMARLAEGASTVADLARLERVKPQSMGATLAALEGDGLVSRAPHPTDGRQVLVRLTDAGLAARSHHRLLKRAWLAHALAGIDAEDRAALTRAVALIGRVAEARGP